MKKSQSLQEGRTRTLQSFCKGNKVLNYAKMKKVFSQKGGGGGGFGGGCFLGGGFFWGNHPPTTGVGGGLGGGGWGWGGGCGWGRGGFKGVFWLLCVGGFGWGGVGFWGGQKYKKEASLVRAFLPPRGALLPVTMNPSLSSGLKEGINGNLKMDEKRGGGSSN